MDTFYDVKGAAARLEEIAKDRYNSEHSGLQLSRVVSITAHYEASLLGRNWKLAHKNMEGSACNEEVVAIFQGIICKKDLPPFTEKMSGNNNTQARYLRQSVTITGLETTTFNKVMNAVANIHTVLGRAVGIDNIQDCTMISCHQGARTLEASNRYFTSRNTGEAGLVSNEIALSTDIDPYGFLTKAGASAGLYHSEENVVAYFDREGSSDKNYTYVREEYQSFKTLTEQPAIHRYKEAKPTIFGIGDIIEVHALFMTFPLKDKRAKSAMILRGLTLLDGSFTQARAQSIIIARPLLAPKALKRKVGYSDEQISATRASMNRMEIDQGEGSTKRVEGEPQAHVESEKTIEGRAAQRYKSVIEEMD